MQKAWQHEQGGWLTESSRLCFVCQNRVDAAAPGGRLSFLSGLRGMPRRDQVSQSQVPAETPEKTAPEAAELTCPA